MHLAEARCVPKFRGEVVSFLDLLFVERDVLSDRRDPHQAEAQSIGAIFPDQSSGSGELPNDFDILRPCLSRIRPVKKTSRNGMLSSIRSDLPGWNSSPAMIMRATP